jgi:importin subunit beta-1
VRRKVLIADLPDVFCRSAKPHVISAFADVAMAIESGFIRYLEPVMLILQQAAEIEIADETDDDLVEYIQTLRETILESYTGILQGLKSEGAHESMLPFLDRIILFIQRSTQSSTKSTEVLKAAIGLVGDLADCFGPRMASVLSQPFVTSMLEEGSEYEEMQQLVKWAYDVSV